MNWSYVFLALTHRYMFCLPTNREDMPQNIVPLPSVHKHHSRGYCQVFHCAVSQVSLHNTRLWALSAGTCLFLCIQAGWLEGQGIWPSSVTSQPTGLHLQHASCRARACEWEAELKWWLVIGWRCGRSLFCCKAPVTIYYSPASACVTTELALCQDSILVKLLVDQGPFH